MAQATTIDVIDSLQTLLDENIEDPNPDRINDQTRWIYTIPINFDMAQYPRIHIHDVSSTHQGLSIGSTERLVEAQIQISIFCGVGEGNKMDIDSDGDLERPIEIVDYLAEEVTTLINDNQDRWNSLGTENNIYNVLTEDEQRIQDTQNQVIQHVVNAVVRHKK